MSATIPTPAPRRPVSIRDLDVPLAVLRAQIAALPKATAGQKAEQDYTYRDLDADSTCCLPGFSCPACPPAAEVTA